ncbi:MAG: M23 family metallopeptidase [Micavibrio sp.]|nr:M23 family metallopeptidase [Micavibrio sp.]
MRLRYISAVALTAAISLNYSMSQAFSPINHFDDMQDVVASIEPLADNNDGISTDSNQISKNSSVNLASVSQFEIGAHISEGIRRASAAIKKPDRPRFREITVKSGQTVAGVLQNAGLNGTEAHNAVQALQEYLDVRKIRAGQKIALHYKPDVQGGLSLSKMEMKLDPIKQVSITRSGPVEFKSVVEEKELVKRTYARKAKIQTSLYGSAALANIPQQVVGELIRIYSHNIDFQRDIRRGDSLQILYDVYENDEGEFVKYGNIKYANLSVGGRDVPIYRYKGADGRSDYYQQDGRSIRKTLMRTPIDGARISSGFGMRHHPVLGYNKMHKGTDFAAPTGTPIYAAGDGVVDYAGRKGAYGNYVRIRHNSQLKTAYAHMHKISKSVKSGTRIRQGEVIGYVGTTGRSTGPHLHYEVLKNGVQVNPRSVDLPTGERLKGQELSKFKGIQDAVYKQYKDAVGDMEVAMMNDENSDENEHKDTKG